MGSGMVLKTINFSPFILNPAVGLVPVDMNYVDSAKSTINRFKDFEPISNLHKISGFIHTHVTF